jgi:hypothetical protein
MITQPRRHARPRAVALRLDGLATGLDPEPTPVEVELRWCPEDPAAVTAVFVDPHTGEPAAWTFARRLLADSLGEPGRTLGAGDVKVTTGGFSAYLQLCATVGSVVVEVPRARVQAFARSVERNAPAALEEQHLGDAVDRALAQLLAR